MKITTLLTTTFITTGIVLGAIATPAFAKPKDKDNDSAAAQESGCTVAVVSGGTVCLDVFDGNDTGNKGTGISNLTSMLGGSWELAGKSDGGFGSFDDGGHGSLSGIFSTGFAKIAGAFSVKASTGYLLFETDDISQFDWSTTGLPNNGGNIPGLSHLSVYYDTAVLAAFDEANSQPTPANEPDPAAVPEPISGVVLGGVGLAHMMRKQRNKKALSDRSGDESNSNQSDA